MKPKSPRNRAVTASLLALMMASLGLLSSCASSGSDDGAAGKKLTIRLGHNLTKGTTLDAGTEKLRQAVSKASHGEMTIQLYPAGQLGNEQQMIQAVSSGTLDMAIITGSTFGNVAPKADVLGIPYAFQDPDHLARAMAGEPGREIEAEIEDKIGVHVLGSWYFGTRQMTSNKPIQEPSDLNGLKLRVVPVPVFVAAWKKLGATPTPIDFQQLYTGLQTHLVDAQENPVSLVSAAAFYEVQKYLDLTGHTVNNFFIIGSNALWNRLTSDQQDMLVEKLQKAGAYERKITVDDENDTIADLQSKGMTVVKPDVDAFRERLSGFAEEYDGGRLADLYQSIQKFRD